MPSVTDRIEAVRDEARDLAALRWAVALVVSLILLTGVTRWMRPIDREQVSASATGYRLPINLASAGELEALPGIGPVLARAIVEHRAEHGPFTDIDALPATRGIGPKTAARVAPWIELDPRSVTKP